MNNIIPLLGTAIVVLGAAWSFTIGVRSDLASLKAEHGALCHRVENDIFPLCREIRQDIAENRVALARLQSALGGPAE